eukprot:362835-Chlamydomonas_euryale.AAC.1
MGQEGTPGLEQRPRTESSRRRHLVSWMLPPPPPQALTERLRMWDSYPLRISGYPRISADMGADSDMNYSYFLRTYWNFTKKVPLES